MLEHTYGNVISTSSWQNHTKDILRASVNYGFNALKSDAESWYMSNFALTVNNVIDELLYADGKGLLALKDFLIGFIVKNVKNAAETVSLESFARLHESSELNDEVMRAIQSSAVCEDWLDQWDRQLKFLEYSTDTHVGHPWMFFPFNEDRVVIHFNNFDQLPRGRWVVSPKFTCARREWTLHLNPSDEYKHVKYCLQAAFKEDVTVDYDLNVRNCAMESLKNVVFPNCFSRHGIGGTISKRKLTKMRRKLSPRDTFALTIVVCIRPQSDFWIHHVVKPIPTLSEYISKLFNDEGSADVAFKVKNEMFYAHQHILKLRAVDLANDFCDSCDKTNPLPIDDVDPKIFCIMLKHSYGMAIPTSVWNNDTTDILKASGKYGFNDLKCYAESEYIDSLNLTVNNVIDELLFADGHNLPKLKKRTMDYIIENGEKILDSETSFSRLNESQRLLKEVMRVTFKSNKRLREDLDYYETDRWG
jgi:hypothetical protein